MISENSTTKVLPSAEGFGQIWMIDERELFELLEQQGKKCYGERFSICAKDYSVIKKLLLYFFSDYDLASKSGVDLSKGIILSGPVGCGKTSLMSIIRAFVAEEQNHVIKPCREIAFEFLSDGYETILKYSMKSFHKSSVPKTFCFDDLGQETKMKYYGNECEVMREIILSRYELFERFKMLTHFTTNLNMKEIELRYGENVASRLCAMTNFIEFNNSDDKRRR